MSDEPSAVRRTVSELKRRRVFRVAGAYAAGSFVVWQAADIVSSALRLPDWTMTLVVLLALFCLPFALLFAWLFDVTPAGVRLTLPADAPGDSAAPPPAPVLQTPILIAIAAALVLTGAGGAYFAMRASNGTAEAAGILDRSVAVLPFVNGSPDPANEYFSDGITEDIIGRLQRLGDLTVISRTTVMSYKGSTKSMREIAAELGVAHVVEGSVRKEANTLRINARLVDAATDQVLWNETFDRELSDVFAVQTEISERIAGALQVQLSEGARDRLAGGASESVVAFDTFLKARKLLVEAPLNSVEDWRAMTYSAIGLLREALALDPRFAQAHAELAYIYESHPDFSTEVQFDSARVMARRAIDAGPDLPDGYAALGFVLQEQQDTAAAAVQYARALELSPSHLETLLGLAQLSSEQLRFVDAMSYTLRAKRVAPNDPDVLYRISSILDNVGDFTGAAEYLNLASSEESLDSRWWLDCELAGFATQAGDQTAALAHMTSYRRTMPDVPFAWNCAGSILLLMGDLEGARHALERYLATLDGSRATREELATTRMGLGYIARQTGDEARGLALLRQAEATFREIRAECPLTCRNSGLGGIMAQLGNTDEAIMLLERAVATGWNGSYPSERHPLAYLYAPVAGDPRYQKILGDLRADFDRQRQVIQQMLVP